MSVPAPLFRDPIYDGAADPTIIWNREEQAWWILYTNRRANVDTEEVAFMHGTDIGIVSSLDGGASWAYRGTLQGLEFERGRNTFWSPEVLYHEGTYHMYVSYVPGVPAHFSGVRHLIVHMTSLNLWDWKFQAVLPLSSEYVIDPCVQRLPNGNWRMWYKDEGNQSFSYAADSPDLYNWTVVGPVITDCDHEGPNVFRWRGFYWMVTDPWQGLGVYRSDDCETWMRQANILVEPGTRKDDGARGDHADVLVQGDEAYIFYFTHPGGWTNQTRPNEDGVYPYKVRQSSLQAARLKEADGQLTCDRDEEFDLNLHAPEEE